MKSLGCVVGVFVCTLTAAVFGPWSTTVFPQAPAPGRVDLAVCLRSTRDAACFSGARLSARAVAGLVAPNAPTNLTASVINTSVTLQWSAPASGDPASTYVLEAGSTTGASNLANFATGSTATAYITTGVPAGIYYVRVRAQNASGAGAASNEIIVVVGSNVCTSPPAAPGGLRSAVDGTTVTLNWTLPAGGCPVTSYVLQAGSTPGSANLANFGTGTTSTTFVANAVANGTYYIRVLGQNGAGTGAPSNEVIVQVGGANCPGAPGCATTDIQPRSVPTLGAVSGCAGGTLTTTFTVTAPAGVTWTVSTAGWTDEEQVTPASGSGTGTLTFRLTARPITVPPGWVCSDTATATWPLGFTISFSNGAGPFSPTLSYARPNARFTLP